MRKTKKPKPYYCSRRKQWRARLRIKGRTLEQWFASKKQAGDQISEWWLDKYAGVDSAGITLGEFSDEWLEALDVRESSRRRYGFDLAYLEPLKVLPLERIRRKVIADLLKKIKSTATRQRVRGLLHQIFVEAVDQELIRSNIVRDVKPVKHVKKPVEIFNNEEIQAIQKQLKGHRYRPPIELMLEVGTRPGETYALKWCDLIEGQLRIERTVSLNKHGHMRVSDMPKTEAGRRLIPLSTRMQELLLEHRKVLLSEGRASKQDWMFQTVTGQMIGNRFRGQILIKLLKDAGVPYRKPHTFRHNAASAMLNGGGPVSIVSVILGHENPSITLGVYSHLVETEKQIAKNFWDKKNHA